MFDPSGRKYTARSNKDGISFDSVPTRPVRRPDPSTTTRPTIIVEPSSTETDTSIPIDATDNNEIASSFLHPLPPPPYTFENGETVDCKNTLRSIAVADDTMQEQPYPIAAYLDGRLANGEFITAKTCAQSFHELHLLDRYAASKQNLNPDITASAAAVNRVNPVVVVEGTTTETPNIMNSTTSTRTNTQTILQDHLPAADIVAEDLLMYADAIQEPSETSDQFQQLDEPHQIRPKRTTTFLIIIVSAMVLVAVVIWVAVMGMGEDCRTTGTCDTTPSTSSRTTTTTVRPVMAPSRVISNPPQTTTSPTISRLPPMDGLWDVICNFLSLPNIAECQSTTMIKPSNSMGTTIPTEIGLLTQVAHLDLSLIRLTGTIPSEIGLLTQLTVLDLSFVGVTGTVPSELGNLLHLSLLNLNKNQLIGTVPTKLGLLTQLLRLSLWDNQLTLTIPTEMAQLTRLTYLDLAANALAGTIPSQFGNLTLLSYLDLYENRLTNTIPSEFGNLRELINLRLEKNRLTGAIPSTLGQLTRMNYWSLYNNPELTGIVPSTLCSATGIGIYIDCANIICSCCNSTSCL